MRSEVVLSQDNSVWSPEWTAEIRREGETSFDYSGSGATQKEALTDLLGNVYLDLREGS